MATYYHGNSEIQGGGNGGDGLQTLILMNPGGYVGYSDTQHPQHHQQQPPVGSNFVFLNSNNHGNSLSLPHAPSPNQTQQFVGIPLTATSGSPTSQDHHTQAQSLHSQHAISALHGYNLYGQTTIDFTGARDVSRAQQGGLSLSLSPRQPGYGSFRPEREFPSQPTGDDLRGSSSSASMVSNGVNGVQSVLLSSKYLKATQEILDEVVSVGKGGKSEGFKGTNGQKNNPGESSMANDGNGENGQKGSEGNLKRSAELSTAERQEIQMKKAKLVNMLDEVEQRYRQYHHQMQIVISWFEQAAGIGSAKTYTSLALKTISKQFRCLKDAILGQIQAASKSLGEEENFGGKIEGSRLKFVDNQLRQQRALQQLGMIQHNAWRPQRGLPERAVSVLRAWLFEHFLHPYPKDSDKMMLAKQTGLTRSQVSNWFINARVRLWKPMVEEMYTEEMKEHDNSNASSDDNNKLTRSENDNSTSKATASQDPTSPSFMSKENVNSQNLTPMAICTTVNSPTGIQNQSGFSLISPSEMESFSHGSPKKLRPPPPSINMDQESNNANDDQMTMKFDNEKQGRDGFTFMGGPTNFIGGFGSYTMGELGRFGADQFPGPYSGNGVSLTLGLPHCENLSMSGNHQSFLQNQGMQVGRGVEMEENDFGNINTPTSTHPTNVYDNLDIQSRKRYAAQLLPDFVA
ncbi:homeodomain transcription factor [Lithospermum erythrorhizon]|uniref:Homeodomain transcription factor n=1 Tax=Lithospermum erythrorhizon TaxID=34254 RepID=A0AAV3S4G2_LITER